MCLQLIRKIAAHNRPEICIAPSRMQCASFEYLPRKPEETVLYRVIAEQLETFLMRQQDRERAVPKFVEQEFRSLGSAAIYDEQPRQGRSSKAFGKSSFA